MFFFQKLLSSLSTCAGGFPVGFKTPTGLGAGQKTVPVHGDGDGDGLVIFFMGTGLDKQNLVGFIPVAILTRVCWTLIIQYISYLAS